MNADPELPWMVFAVCNVLRIAAYFPQMVKIVRHPQGAAGFSFAAWTLFTAANGSTAVYAATSIGDIAVAWTHGVSAACCLVLLALAAWRSHRPAVVPV